MSATDSPATTRLESPYLQDELRRLVTLLETELAGSRGTVTGVSESQRQQHVRLRMLYLLAGQTDRALDVIPGLPRAEQEFWQNYFWAMSNELDSRSTADRPAQAARTAALIEVSQRHLRELTNLEVRDICFCQRINSFGNYERFLRDEFPPGQPILVYAELKNFHSELCLDGMYRTRLRTTIEIVPVEDGVSLEPVDRRDFPATEDVCRSMRNDYFNSYRIDIPANLAAGRYLLRVLVLDEVGNKRATEEVPFFVR